MKRWIITCFAVSLLLSGQTGCGRNDTVYLEKASVSEDTEETGTPKQEEGAGDTENAGMRETPQGTVQSTEDAGAGEAAQSAEDAGEAAQSRPRVCYVYVCGAVREAGVYALPEGSRIYEAIALAGGLSDEACADYVNQAEVLADGQMIRIPTEAEAADLPREASASDGTTEQASEPADDRVDLNTAGMAELTALPGIGEAKAERILAYRESHGGFSAAEDIMKVEGIKEGVYNRIKDYIRVK